MPIYPVEHQGETNYVISSGGSWLPGSYATEQAARYAYQFPCQQLQALMEAANAENRVITTDDLRALAKKNKTSQA